MDSTSRAKDLSSGDATDVPRDAAEREEVSGKRPLRFAGAGPVRWALNLLVAGALLALVLWKVHPGEIRDAFGKFEPWPAALAVALNGPALALMALRGQSILRRLGHRVGFLPFFPISTFGNVLGALTPAGAGDLLRTPFLRSRHDIPYSHGVALVIYERGISMFTLAAGSGVAAAWIVFPVWGAVAVSVAAVAIVAAVPYLAALLLNWVAPWIGTGAEDGSASGPARLREALTVSVESLRGLLRDLGTNVAVVTCSLGVFSIGAVQLWLVAESLGFTLNAAEAWVILGAALLAGIITLLPLGFGTFDITLAALLGAMDVSAESAAAATILVRATVTLPLGIAALASYALLVSSELASSPPRHAGN